MSNPTFRMTRQRQVILEELRKVDSHPTAAEIYEMVRRRLPQVSLGTVYRNLDILCERGMIQKLDLAGTQRRFDGTIENHYHVSCTHCGRVNDVPIEPLAALDNALRNVSDYQIIGHRVKFIGICPQCNQKEPQSAQKAKRAF